MDAEHTLSSRRVYEGPVLGLRIDEVELPTGRSARREVVEHGDAVCVVAVDGEGKVVLVRQYRHATGQVLLEIPAGNIEPGEAPQEAAQRELREEAGRLAQEWLSIGGFFAAPGYSTEFLYLFLARDLQETNTAPDEDEAIQVELAPLADVPSLIRLGEIRDAKSVAGILQALYMGAVPAG